MGISGLITIFLDRIQTNLGVLDKVRPSSRSVGLLASASVGSHAPDRGPASLPACFAENLGAVGEGHILQDIRLLLLCASLGLQHVAACACTC